MSDMLDGKYTIFVPADPAVQKLLRSHLYLEHSPEIRRILGGHIVDGILPVSQLTSQTPVMTRAGPLWVTRGHRGLLANCEPLLSRDRPTPGGGVIHTVEGVLHSDRRSLVQVVRDRPELSTLAQMLVETGLADELDRRRSLTLFAPTNEAFEKIQLPEDAYMRKEILRSHILSGLQCRAGLPGGGTDGRGRPTLLFADGSRGVTVVPRLQEASSTVQLAGPGLITATGLLQTVTQVIMPPFAVATLTTLRRLEDSARFAHLLANAGLSDQANGENVTLLVPPSKELSGLPDTSRGRLRSLLSPHLLSGSGLRPEPGGALWAQPLSGGRPLLVTAPSPGPAADQPPLVQCSAVLGQLDLDKPAVDVLGIGQVLTPPAADLLTALNSRPELSNFARAVQLSGLADVLGSGLSDELREGDLLTLLAPVNPALVDISYLDTTQKAADFVRVHLIRGAVCCGGMNPYLTPYRRLDGGRLLMASSSDGGATVLPLDTLATGAVDTVSCDLVTSNGVLHTLRRPLEGPGADTDPLSDVSELQLSLFMPAV
ncbi:transforming growth factor-beta-induced protein ig-h3-like [Amphibalanus amphitrite]|uniref:transforming growth factor-beta-induced protein ig-h3-like n=1 Tax=Amphibalanus amphitrite TaxID=1232801 RepID=UPI001C9001A5|nr:transforming growth factor-beta-induced protein ig-h3-like [Amphibalanus amphitrite]